MPWDPEEMAANIRDWIDQGEDLPINDLQSWIRHAVRRLEAADRLADVAAPFAVPGNGIAAAVAAYEDAAGYRARPSRLMRTESTD